MTPPRIIYNTRFFLAVTALFATVGYGLYGHTEELHYGRHSALAWMVRRWEGAGGDLSHGWLIPLVSLVLLWRMRADLKELPKQQDPLALFFLLGAVLLLPLGMRVQQTRISLLSLIGVLWTVPWFLWGWNVARRILFPVAYLLFCIPLSFLDSLTFRLRLLTASLSTWAVEGLGVPALRRGTAIIIGTNEPIPLDVADPCSGLRSVLALTALTAVFAYVTQRSLIRKWLLFLCSIPIAVAANTLRVILICVVAMTAGLDAAVGLYHDYSGYIIFLAGVSLVAATGKVIDTIGKKRHEG
jgi:exosortase